MHEFSICSQIIEEARKHGKPVSVSIEVGETSGIEPEHLKEHLKAHVDWDIEVSERKASVRCRCGYHGRPEIVERGHDFVIVKCPRCGNNDVEREQGGQIILKSVKVDDND